MFTTLGNDVSHAQFRKTTSVAGWKKRLGLTVTHHSVYRGGLAVVGGVGPTRLCKRWTPW